MSLALILAIAEALPRIAASGTEAFARFMAALHAVGDDQLNAQLAKMKAEDLRRGIISENEAAN
jgi:hypothetical protein